MANDLKSPLLDVPEEVDAAYECLYELGVTDGLPVIPPTEDRVARFVAASGRPAGAEIADMPPKNGVATVEKIAINAVMAGCRPEYMPLLIATVEAVCEERFDLHGIQTTTSPVSPLIVVNGPIRRQLDLNCGRGMLGPGWRANATIGRALRLMMLNIGGGVPGEVDKATHGWPGKFTTCFGELEEESPWEPLHVERGLRPDQSAVTVIGIQGTYHLLAMWKEAKSIFLAIGSGVATMATNAYFNGSGHPTVILSPGHAQLLAEQGYSKRQVKEAIFEHSKVPLTAWPAEPSRAPGTPNIVGDWTYPTRRPEDIVVIVAGGPEAYHITYCAAFSKTAANTKAIK